MDYDPSFTNLIITYYMVGMFEFTLRHFTWYTLCKVVRSLLKFRGDKCETTGVGGPRRLRDMAVVVVCGQTVCHVRRWLAGRTLEGQ